MIFRVQQWQYLFNKSSAICIYEIRVSKLVNYTKKKNNEFLELNLGPIAPALL